ncbi:hypothetical protein RchiOBHm_Chr2g0146321 [Rosa chinensis]|uniref:Uncharacterized protein n=1 Tax=Rosa chinensis TaxID=74649 RepID=A0A2P6RYU8_ROSCH|nr:hypothetical protein RchiOBHm_Chr2g0146321 [Rosa chinensis]
MLNTLVKLVFRFNQVLTISFLGSHGSVVFFDTGDISGTSGLSFHLEFTCRRGIKRLSGLLASKSSAQQRSSSGKRFCKPELDQRRVLKV